MKLSNDEFRTLTRNFLTEGLEGNEERRLHEQDIPGQQPDSGPQSFDDFTQRMSAATGMLESLYRDYARFFPRGGWLMDTGNEELARDLSSLYSKASNLLNSAESAAEKTGEI